MLNMESAIAFSRVGPRLMAAQQPVNSYPSGLLNDIFLILLLGARWYRVNATCFLLLTDLQPSPSRMLTDASHRSSLAFVSLLLPTTKRTFEWTTTSKLRRSAHPVSRAVPMCPLGFSP